MELSIVFSVGMVVGWLISLLARKTAPTKASHDGSFIQTALLYQAENHKLNMEAMELRQKVMELGGVDGIRFVAETRERLDI